MATQIRKEQIGDEQVTPPKLSPDVVEYVQDIVAQLFASGTHTNITIAYDDVTGSISITGGGVNSEQVQDIVGAMIGGGTGITVAYDDNANTFTISTSKSQLGLENVDNTADLDKPISTATQNALNTKVNTTSVGEANGVASLDGTGKVPSSQLPAFVDDVLEYANFAALPATGTAEVIYVTLNDNKTFRWSGSSYVEISASLALGETSSTAYRGDRGKTAYDHSQDTTTNPHNVTKAQVGLGNADNTSDADKPISNATATALAGKASTTHTHSTTDISNLAEFIQDTIGATLVAGSNVTITYDDLTNTITISSTGGGGGSQEVFVQATQPVVTAPAIWIEEKDDTFSLWYLTP